MVHPVEVGSIASLRLPLASTLLAVDYDGTLAPIVDDPADAHPLPGVPETLVRLAESGQGAHLDRVAPTRGPVTFRGDGRTKVDPGARVRHVVSTLTNFWNALD